MRLFPHQWFLPESSSHFSVLLMAEVPQWQPCHIKSCYKLLGRKQPNHRLCFTKSSHLLPDDRAAMRKGCYFKDHPSLLPYPTVKSMSQRLSLCSACPPTMQAKGKSQGTHLRMEKQLDLQPNLTFPSWHSLYIDLSNRAHLFLLPFSILQVSRGIFFPGISKWHLQQRNMAMQKCWVQSDF